MALKMRVTNTARGERGDGTKIVAVTAEVFDDADPATVMAGPMTREFELGTTRAAALRYLVAEFKTLRERAQLADNVQPGATVDAA